MSGRVTMFDISREAGVSPAVVSKVLVGGRESIRVSDETANRVRHVAKRLGYIANSAARAVRNGRFNAVALLQSSNFVYSLLPAALLSGIQNSLAEVGMHLIYSELPDERLINEGFIPKILSELCSDGLLINYNTEIPEKMIKLIKNHKIPSVWINSKQEKNCVYPDDYNAVKEATLELIKLGHRKIAYANFNPGKHYSCKDRLKGYLDAMLSLNLRTIEFQTKAHIELRDSKRVALEFFSKSRVIPTAIICYTEKEFSGFYYAAKELDIKVPQDLSLITFSPTPLENPEIIAATYLLPQREIGQTAVRMLLELIKDPGKIFAPVPLKLIFYRGETISSLKYKEGGN